MSALRLLARSPATNAGGSASANSNGVGPIVPLPPANTLAPAITDITDGTFAVGNQLICTNGTWTGAPTYTRVWTHGGTAIAGETGPAYTIEAAYVGEMIGATVNRDQRWRLGRRRRHRGRPGRAIKERLQRQPNMRA